MDYDQRDSQGNLRMYYPDFIAVNGNERLIIETKGMVDG